VLSERILEVPMSKHYPERKRNRLPEYNYSNAGYYFVTLLTKNRVNFFGDIVDTGISFSTAGEIASKYWQDIPNHYSNIKPDEFIIMPNHIHGIIIIAEAGKVERTARCAVLTGKDQKKELGNLSNVIRMFKIMTKRDIRGIANFSHFDWHRSFFDHVIRNEQSLGQIRQYIKTNPFKWHLDEYFR
jgi:putative transposase